MSVFKFKQFDIDQTNCAMKVNTDGVLLGALAHANTPERILDIGTGTGVIALMLAQRFNKAKIAAVEIDDRAAGTAAENLKNSVFASRLQLFATGFEQFFQDNQDIRYDLIVSNPPFFLNSLTSQGARKNLARHTYNGFYNNLITAIAIYLTDKGTCQLILPLATAELVKQLIFQHQLHLQQVISIRSFADTEPHREIITFGRIEAAAVTRSDFVIYAGQKKYSNEYKIALKDFLTIF